jgi:uroporphyrin-III C-methyltransferase
MSDEKRVERMSFTNDRHARAIGYPEKPESPGFPLSRERRDPPGLRLPGKVFLVGAGPGAPDLITVRAAQILGQANIVFHDALVHPDTIALATRAEKIAVGKRCGKHSTAQRFINKRLIEAARKYPVVVRLKGGDPMLFGRAQEEIAALRQAGIAVEVVPGVTAALAASAQIGVSLTQRGVSRSVVFATPRTGEGEDASDWLRSALAGDTVVLYMAAGHAREIARQLIAGGLSALTPVVIVESATLPGSDVQPLTLGELELLEQPVRRGPALLMIGEVFRDAVAGAHMVETLRATA